MHIVMLFLLTGCAQLDSASSEDVIWAETRLESGELVQIRDEFSSLEYHNNCCLGSCSPPQSALEWEYVDAVRILLETDPNSEILAVSLSPAFLLLQARGSYEAARSLLEQVENSHATPLLTGNATLSAMFALSQTGDWQWGARLLQESLSACMQDPRSVGDECRRLEAGIAFNANEEARDLLNRASESLRDGDQRRAQALTASAAGLMLDLYEQLPDREFAPQALLNAAYLLQLADDPNGSDELLDVFLRSFPEHPEVPTVLKLRLVGVR